MDHGLSDAPIGTADADILIGTAEASLGMPFEMSQHKERIIVQDALPHVHFRKPFAAFNRQRGDAVLIQVAGATIVDPYGEAMRSLLVAVGELGVRHIMVIGHTDCGTCGMHADHLAHALVEAGVPAEQIARERAARPELDRVLTGFADLACEVASSVRTIRTHPLMPAGVHVTGYTIGIETGALTPVAA